MDENLAVNNVNVNENIIFSFQNITNKMSILNINSSQSPQTSNSVISESNNFLVESAAAAVEVQTNVNNIDISFQQQSQTQTTNSPTNKLGLRLRSARKSFTSSDTKDDLHRINRRTIQKPKKCNQLDMSPSAIKKFYIQAAKQIKKFKPTNLETIFEEPTQKTDLDGNKTFDDTLMSLKKMKRSLSCSDGLNVTKATIKSRRAKIKRQYGKRFALKKISLAEFHDKLNKSLESNSFDDNDSNESNNVNDNDSNENMDHFAINPAILTINKDSNTNSINSFLNSEIVEETDIKIFLS